MQPTSVTDFSGGFTDYYVAGPSNKYQRASNLLIKRHGGEGKLQTRAGSVLYDPANAQLPTGSQRIGTLRLFEGRLLAHSARDLYAYNAGWNALSGPTGNKLFPAGTTVDNVTSHARWGKTLYFTNDSYTAASKIYADQTGTLQLRTAGLPPLATVPSAVGVPPGTRAVIYRFIHEYEYKVGTLTFKDLGPSVEVAITNGNATTAITAIPVLANGTVTNYDTTALKIGIYRTTNTGTTFYKVGEVTNGTTSFTDTVTDLALIDNEPLYTEGGVSENSPPPLCKLVHVVGNVGYWANIKEGTEIRGNRLRQSIPGDIDSVPEDFFVDIDDDIVGLSSARDVPILLGETSAWRVDGTVDELGRGQLVAQKISDTTSCISSQSVVQTLEGVFWCGVDGIYYTDGASVLRINEDWDQTYVTLTATAAQKRRIQGKYDAVNRRVWWSVQSPDSGEVDLSIVLDLHWGVRPAATFTSCEGAANWAPTAIEFDGRGNLIRGDRRGYVFLHDDDLRNDPLVNETLSPALWQETTIIYDFISSAMNFGNDAIRKVCTWFSIQCANRSNLSLQPISINDNGRVVEKLQAVRFRGNYFWGDPSTTWGNPDDVWNREGIIEARRRFPARSFRCSYKQMRLTNSYSVIDSSDVLGTAAINAALKQVNLDNALSTFASTYPGYYIAFEADGYTKDYLITAVASDILTYADIGNTSVTSVGQKFEIRGHPKSEIMDLLSMTVWYDNFSTTQRAFHAADTGKVGA